MPLFVLSRLLSSLGVSRTESASDWCGLQEALYNCIDTTYNTIQYNEICFKLNSKHIYVIVIWLSMVIFSFTAVRVVDIAEIVVPTTLREARRVVGNIWCIGASEPSSRPVRDANLGNPRRLTSSSLAR